MSYKVDCLKCVKSDWIHKWCRLDNYRLYDYVKGPLKFPMVTIPMPYVVKEKGEENQCDCGQYLKECYSKPGIPDPWSEYLILKRETEKGNDLSSDFPKHDFDITRYLNRHYRVYIGQGIPDPWKKWTHLEPLEPNFDNFRKNWKTYADNLRNGPGSDMYDLDKVCCPNCNRQLMVLCLKSSNREQKQVVKEVANTDSDTKPVEEKSVEQKIYSKDASVETDDLPDAKSDEVQIPKKCSCKLTKICTCNNCLSCPVCYEVKKESKAERSRCRQNDSYCNCKKNSIKNGCSYDDGRNSPIRNKCDQQYFPVTDPSPLLKLNSDHSGSTIPFFCINPGRRDCSAQQQFIGFKEKNNHNLELQLICLKCERKRKKKRQTKCGPRKENHFPCHCPNNGKANFVKYANVCDICNHTCKFPDYKKQTRPDTIVYGNNPCRCCCSEANKPRIFEDRDYLRLLKILGCSSFFSNEPDMDCDEPKTTGNKKISSKSKGRSFSIPNHSWEDEVIEISDEGFYDSETGWRDHKYKQYGKYGSSTGTRNEFEPFQKDSKYTNKKPILRRTPYNSHCTVDELRRIRNRLRQKSRKAFRKELNHFLSNCRNNGLGNSSESSTETRRGEMNAENKARKSNWQKDGNFK